MQFSRVQWHVRCVCVCVCYRGVGEYVGDVVAGWRDVDADSDARFSDWVEVAAVDRHSRTASEHVNDAY